MRYTKEQIIAALTFLQAANNIEDLKEKMLDMQMEIDILKETIHVLKKDPGVDQTVLRTERRQ